MNWRQDLEAAAAQQADSDWHRQQCDDERTAQAARAELRAAANSHDPDAAAHVRPAHESANRTSAVPHRATARRKPAPKAEQPQPQASELDAAVEDLVRRYSSGAVIEAAWEAAHRIFHPNQGARQ